MFNLSRGAKLKKFALLQSDVSQQVCRFLTTRLQSAPPGSLVFAMNICGCFSPNPRLGKNNGFEDDAEHPELAFTDKQHRFSQDVLTGLRGMSAPTTAVSCDTLLCPFGCLLLNIFSTSSAPLYRKHITCFERSPPGKCALQSNVR